MELVARTSIVTCFCASVEADQGPRPRNFGRFAAKIVKRGKLVGSWGVRCIVELREACWVDQWRVGEMTS